MSKQSLYETFSKQIKPVTTTLTTLNKPLQVVNKNVKLETRQPTFEDGLGINSNRQIPKQDLKEQRQKQQKQFEQEQKDIQERLKQQQQLQKQTLQKQQQSQLQLQSRPQNSQQSSREQVSAQQPRTQQPKSRPIEQEIAPPSQRTQQLQQQPSQPIVKQLQQPIVKQQPQQPIAQQSRPQQQVQSQQSARQQQQYQQPQQQQQQQQPQQQRIPIKEQQIQKQAQPRQVAAPPSEFPDDERLYECPEGCGRSFNARALEKHSKVCQKVFQQKRKAFNSAEQRIVEEEIQVIKPVQQKKGAKKEPEKPQKQSAKPKWLAQSEAFRAVIKQAKGAELTKEETAQLKQTMEESQGLVQCKFCGRKFNAETAKKHTVFCETKSKQQVSKPKKK